MIWFYANSRCASIVKDEDITTGSVGLEVGFSLSAEWKGLAKTAVFRAGDISVDVYLSEDHCAVPPELLTVPEERLTIGLYGTGNGGELVIPTVYAEAGHIRQGAAPSGIEPTPQTQPLIDQLLEAAEAARDLAQSVRDDADRGAFDGEDGADGSGVWYTTGRISGDENPFVRRRDLIGREGATVQEHDLLFAPDVGDEGAPTTLYEITSVGTACALNRLCKMQGPAGPAGQDGASGRDGTDGQDGQDGYSPEVTITSITGGNRVTITDADHQSGQSFDVMDGEQGPAGPSGGQFWSADSAYTTPNYTWPISILTGPTGGTPAVGDLVYYSAYRYTITSIDTTAGTVTCTIRASIRGLQGPGGPAGQDGYSPEVTITSITGGHRVTITDEDHPDGQSFDVMDGTGGGWSVTVDSALSDSSENPVQNKVIKAALDAKYKKPSGGIPASDLEETYLTQHQDISGKADKVTEVTNTSTGDVTLQLDPGKIYHFTGAISSLTLTLATPASGQLAQYHFDFDSGSTAATISISGVTWPGGSFTPEASTHYEVDILNSFGLYIGWEVSSS